MHVKLIIITLFYLFITLPTYGAFYFQSPVLEVANFSEFSKLAKSIAIPVSGMKNIPQGYTTTFTKVNEIERSICPTEKYLDQPIVGLGTGFLISSNLLLMTAHTAKHDSFCRDNKFVFDYQVGNLHFKDIAHLHFQHDQVYSCEHVYYDFHKDLAIVQLDREVLDRPYFILEDNLDFAQNDDYMMIGHHLGLPMKISFNGKISFQNSEFIHMSISAFAGNSGSPVLHQGTNKLIGMLIAGQDDFHENSNLCKEYKICKEDLSNCKDYGFQGEQILKIQSNVIAPLLDKKKRSIYSLVQMYNPLVKEKFGKEINLKFHQADINQATGGVTINGPEITFYRGMLNNFSEQEIAATTCHEIGHILGEVHLNLQPGNAVEGEAEYFSGQCLYQYFQRSNHQMKFFSYDDYCESQIELFGRKKDCTLAILAAQAITAKLYDTPFVDYRLALSQKFNGINPRYPSSECRLLSIMNGITNRARPKCWYNP